MSEQNNANLSEEDYLRKHLEGIETKSQPKTNKQEERLQDQPMRVENSRVSDLHYFAFDAKLFPCGMFYPSGATIQIRAAEVKEVQAYSMVDDSNFYDIVEKMNEILASCVRVKYLDGKVGSYLDIRDPDRYFLIFLIRELTFQQGTSLTTTSTCSCGNEVQIELKRENFKFYKIDEKIEKHFDHSTSSFRFKIRGNKIFNLAPPTIGLQKSFTDYIIKENAEKRKPNLSFLKIIPFLLWDKTSITIEGIKSKLEEYQKMDDISFQFLNSAVEKMTFGIEELKKRCNLCGLEVHTEMIFPNGASGIFVIPNAFEEFIEE